MKRIGERAAEPKTAGAGVKRGTFFKTLMLILLCSCALTAVLSGVIYGVTGVQLFAHRIAEEMVPRARGIARLASRYQTGQLSFDSFIDLSTKEQQGSLIYIFDSQGNLVAYSDNAKLEQTLPYVSKIAAGILADGKSCTSTEWRSVAGIVAGAPITDNMLRTTGAVLMSRPTNEVYLAMAGLWRALILSCLVAAAIMIVPGYWVSRSVSKPILQMKSVAVAMANGDFSSRADESRRDEIGLLGASLNHLSDALCANISDLVLARNRLNTILFGLNEGIVALDAGQGVLYSNPAALLLLGCEGNETRLPAAMEGLLPLAAEVNADRASRTKQLTVGERILLATVSFSQAAVEEGAGTVVLLQDVTESERLEQTRRDYVANVSHELRTPIASVRSLAEALNDGMVKSEEDRTRYYGYILRESLRLTRLINDLLELSRLQSGSIALEKTVFPLTPLLEETTERLRVSAAYSGITLQFDPPDTPCTVCSNRDRIEQVLVALLDNAIKYCSDEGSVRVSVQTDDERATVVIANTGHIAEKDLPHLFERFYKADASHSDGGTGLGLAIVWEIMARLNETVAVVNEGDTAVFSFTVARA